MDTTHPHGYCECASGIPGMCCLGRGPAAFEVEREGKKVLLCTRCDLPDDRPSRRLLVTKEDDFGVYLNFDALGAFCIADLLNPEEAA